MMVRAIVQARMGSSRLPGKVLLHLGDRTVLGHVLSRAMRAGSVDDVVVATTTSSRDDPVVAEAKRWSAAVFRGSEEDVLSRYEGAAGAADVIVRITADCPLLDPQVLESMVLRFVERNRPAAEIDYLSNTLTRSYPRGLDVEVFTRQALAEAAREALLAAEREHVTPYIYWHPERFRVEQFVGRPDLSHHRWTLDTDEDLRFLREVFRRLGPGRYADFDTTDILGILQDSPELMAINAEVEQKVAR